MATIWIVFLVAAIIMLIAQIWSMVVSIKRKKWESVLHATVMISLLLAISSHGMIPIEYHKWLVRTMMALAALGSLRYWRSIRPVAICNIVTISIILIDRIILHAFVL